MQLDLAINAVEVLALVGYAIRMEGRLSKLETVIAMLRREVSGNNTDWDRR